MKKQVPLGYGKEIISITESLEDEMHKYVQAVIESSDKKSLDYGLIQTSFFLLKLAQLEIKLSQLTTNIKTENNETLNSI